MTVHDETINFGDGAAPDHAFRCARPISARSSTTTRSTRTTGEISGFNNDDPMVLRWTGSDPGTLFNAVLKLDDASNWTEFRAALSDWDVPSQNFVYADAARQHRLPDAGKHPDSPRRTRTA